MALKVEVTSCQVNTIADLRLMMPNLERAIARYDQPLEEGAVFSSFLGVDPYNPDRHIEITVTPA